MNYLKNIRNLHLQGVQTFRNRDIDYFLDYSCVSHAHFKNITVYVQTFHHYKLCIVECEDPGSILINKYRVGLTEKNDRK